MIVLDTHIWVWWTMREAELPAFARARLAAGRDVFGVSVVSCWEIALLVQKGRLVLPCSVLEWIRQALGYPSVRLLNLTPEIAVESTQLPDDFHRDPADQLIVATARIHDVELLTIDGKILSYPFVKLVTR